MFSTLAAEFRDNEDSDPIFFKKRKDKQYDMSIGLNYVPAPSWIIKPLISYSKNKSNIDLNDFDRSIISINVRKDFSW